MKLDKESVLQEIIEQTLAGYWDLDISSFTPDFSPSFKKMFGYEDDELDNSIDSWKKLIFQEDFPVISEKFHQYLKSNGKTLFNIEVRYHHKNGLTVWVLSTGKIIEWDDNGNAKRMVGYNIDITERRSVEVELKIALDKYDSLGENIPGIVYRCKYDDNWTMLYLSDAVALLTGYEACDLIHNATRTYESLIHPEDTASMNLSSRNLLRSNIPAM